MTSPQPVPGPVLHPARTPEGQQFLELKAKFGMYTMSELSRYIRQIPATQSLVNNLIPASSVNLLVGDSGIGKSPLATQLALAIAAGLPFLGFKTRQAKVLLADYENAPWDTHRILYRQRQYMGLAASPGASNLLVWPMPSSPVRDLLHENVERVIEILAPDLVILDSLRSFSPTMESDNCAATVQIRRLRDIATRRGTAFLLVHHLRKSGHRQNSPLEDSPVLEWLVRSAGARALINQTDVRLAIAPRKNSRENELVLRGHCRTRGEVGPYLLTRMWDETGEAAGYERLRVTSAMIENPEQEEAFHRLPESFSFSEAMQIYGRRQEATNGLLHKLVRLGLVSKPARGQYQKCEPAPEAPETPVCAVPSST